MASLIYKIGVLALSMYLKLTEILGNEKSKRGNIGRKKWKQNLAGLDTKKKLFGFMPLHMAKRLWPCH
ncbi:MAG: hypothetical protein CL827_06185 [Crocinitomicaceae bacterium]|nr:hypothetical protein [Crocinitomicaceae bacterium]